jgi:hypothetical protein
VTKINNNIPLPATAPPRLQYVFSFFSFFSVFSSPHPHRRRPLGLPVHAANKMIKNQIGNKKNMHAPLPTTGFLFMLPAEQASINIEIQKKYAHSGFT